MRTFPDFSNDESYIFSFSLKLLNEIFRRLRTESLKTSLIGFILITKDFRVLGLKKKFPQPTDDDVTSIALFQEMFKQIYQTNLIYRKSGFFLDHLIQKNDSQPSLFDSSNRGELSTCIDEIYRKFQKIKHNDQIKHNPLFQCIQYQVILSSRITRNLETNNLAVIK